MSDEAELRNNGAAKLNGNSRGSLLRSLFAAALVATSLSPLARSPALAQQPGTAKPNILVIFGDDIGQSNISAYTRGVVGYKTPNIDRIANEGMMFTDYYAENSCTGRPIHLHHRAGLPAHRPLQGRHSRRDRRPAGSRRHHRTGAEAARLRDRSVRQEPSRRPR
ncbi:hypothetical protein ABIF13_005192 [Bradyrhizobium elkanii]